jgi:ABC-type polysaccharide/polyol phosphate export permease
VTGLGPRLRRVGSLLTILVPREIRLRYRENALDMAWALITPVAIMAVYGVVLSQSLNVEGSCAPYLTSAWTGLVLWTFFATALGTAVWCLVSSAELITKVYFPREAIPLSVTGATLIDLGIGVLTIGLVAAFQHVSISPMALAALPSLLLLVVWTAALCNFAAAMAVFLRDVTQVVQLGLRIGFFATPVMYEPDFLPAALAWTASLNPIAVAIAGVRAPVLCGTAPDWPVIAAQLVAGGLLLFGSVLYLRAVEGRMADVV